MRSACEQHTRGAARGSGRLPVARDAQAALAARRRRLQRTGATCSWRRRREPAQPRATALAAHARNTRKRSRPAPQPWGQHNTIRPVLAAVRGAHAEGQLQLEQLGCDGASCPAVNSVHVQARGIFIPLSPSSITKLIDYFFC